MFFLNFKSKEHLATQQLLGTYKSVPQIRRSGIQNRNDRYREILRPEKGN